MSSRDLLRFFEQSNCVELEELLCLPKEPSTETLYLDGKRKNT